MKTDHVFGSHIYVISNYGVARNPIFTNRGDLKTFEELVEKYLSPVCDILSFGYNHNQFQYIIKVNTREKMEAFYLKKYMEKIKAEPRKLIIPETYIIFSQQVSNLLNAYAKRFNKKYNRMGGLFAARYSKVLIESEADLNMWKRNLENSIPIFRFSKHWAVVKKNRWNFGEVANKEGRRIRTSLSILNLNNKDLRGSFECLPPRRINSPNIAQLWTNFFQKMGFPPPW